MPKPRAPTGRRCAAAIASTNCWTPMCAWQRARCTRGPAGSRPSLGGVGRKRFDTRFFLATVPSGQEATHDDHEATESAWLTPRAALRSYWDGEHRTGAAADHEPRAPGAPSQRRQRAGGRRRMRPPPCILPEAHDDDGVRVLCYPGDRAPPARRADAARAHAPVLAQQALRARRRPRHPARAIEPTRPGSHSRAPTRPTAARADGLRTQAGLRDPIHPKPAGFRATTTGIGLSASAGDQREHCPVGRLVPPAEKWRTSVRHFLLARRRGTGNRAIAAPTRPRVFHLQGCRAGGTYARGQGHTRARENPMSPLMMRFFTLVGIALGRGQHAARRHAPTPCPGAQAQQVQPVRLVAGPRS